MIPLTVHPSHRCAVAHANRLTPDSLLARTCVHGAGPPRCRVANRPFSSMRYGDRRGWGGAWYVPCKTPRQQRQGRRMPPQDDLPSRAVRHDGRHGSSGGGARRRRGQRRGVNPHGAQRWSAACWGRWHRSALYRWRGRADDRRRHTQYQQHLDNLRRKGLLPRLKNDRSTCLLGWLFCLELCRFCLSCGVGRPLRCATPRPIRLPWSGSRLRAPTRAPCSRCDITVGWGPGLSIGRLPNCGTGGWLCCPLSFLRRRGRWTSRTLRDPSRPRGRPNMP